MNTAQTQALRHLLQSRRIASLGTIHEGKPYVSMVPFALLPEGSGLVIHVSQLSPHTKDMLENPQVSLLVVAQEAPDAPAPALARVTIQGRAEPFTASAPGYDPAREAYLERFPEALDILELPDFSLFAIWPISVRFIAGFAQALTLSPEHFAAALR
jgi:hypothetical protein